MKFEQELEKTKNPAIKRIAEFLIQRANEDKFVAATLENDKKSLSGCYDYIESIARKKEKNGCAVLEDGEVFYLAQHYYQESDDDLKKETNLEIKAIVPAATQINDTQPVNKPKRRKNNKKSQTEDELIKESGQLSLF